MKPQQAIFEIISKCLGILAHSGYIEGSVREKLEKVLINNMDWDKK